MSLDHDFECYRIWVAPIILKHFVEENKKLKKELEKKRDHPFFFFDRLNNFVSSREEYGITSDEVLDFVLNFKKEKEDCERLLKSNKSFLINQNNNQQKLLAHLENVQSDPETQIACDNGKCREILTPEPIEQGQDDPEVCLYCQKCRKTYFLDKAIGNMFI